MDGSAPKYTPLEILEAGRRAELEGRNDYAVQFYRHILASFPGTAEAVSATDGLTRLINRQPQFLRRPPAFRPPEPKKTRFVFGRLLAFTLTAGGICGLISAVAAVVVPANLIRQVPSEAHELLTLPLSVLVPAALCAVLVGEALRALFSAANAVNDMADLARKNMMREPRR